jgi:hypothetical protein
VRKIHILPEKWQEAALQQTATMVNHLLNEAKQMPTTQLLSLWTILRTLEDLCHLVWIRGNDIGMFQEEYELYTEMIGSNLRLQLAECVNQGREGLQNFDEQACFTFMIHTPWYDVKQFTPDKDLEAIVYCHLHRWWRSTRWYLYRIAHHVDVMDLSGWLL